MIKAVLFDVDGVLLDSDEQYVELYEGVGKAFGLKSPGGKWFRKRFGIAAEDIIPEAYGNNMKIVELFKTLEEKMHVDITDGVEKVLQSIKVKKGIVSTKDMRLIKKFLGNIVDEFDVVISGNDTKKHKPNPEPLLLACDRLGVNPNDTMYIGDAIADYLTAKNAGANFIGFVNGGATEEEFREAGAETTVHSMKELQDELANMGVLKLQD
ncbi:HAD family hydrolase [archaeon]|nr:MAG: HAD family hydrolase [archaeon]